VAGNIEMKSSDLDLESAVLRAVAAPSAGEREFEERMKANAERERIERERIARFRSRAARETDATIAPQATDLGSADQENRGKVMDALRKPGSEEFRVVKDLYRHTLARECDEEDIPRGKADQLKTYYEAE
jgi:hypothetical protein